MYPKCIPIPLTAGNQWFLRVERGIIFLLEYYTNLYIETSLPLIQEGQLSVSGERMCTVLVNRLED